MGDKVMEIYKYGNDQASMVLIQMVGEHELPGINQEIIEIRRLTNIEFLFIAAKVNNWNHDLSPWNCSSISVNMVSEILRIYETSEDTK